MGVNKHTNKILYDSLPILQKDVDLLLIGDLFIRVNLRKHGFRKANQHYRAEGFRSVTSMDINGKADISIDLSIPVAREYRNNYRAIINGGTAEHVSNQKIFFENIDDMAKVGAIIIHVGPEEGSFPGHCEYYYTEEFYYRYAKIFRYQILTIERHKHRQGWAIYGAFKK